MVTYRFEEISDASSCGPAMQIREETNTKIDLPTENSDSEMIVITGRRANCEAARERILAIQRELVRCRSTAARLYEDPTQESMLRTLPIIPSENMLVKTTDVLRIN